ncbi:nitroreductase family deazaflavin-dependent oxidoreductase [Mycobacterium sp. URHB0021]|jgi:deazaflavin-dependent oxidoreductase (nitroreductase family)
MTESTEEVAAFRAMNEPVVDEFRASGGRVGGQFENINLLLLTMTGAKSGQPRLAPLAYFVIDGKTIIVGSKGGAPSDPDWVRNIRANPRVQVEVGTDTYEAIARELPSEERDETYPKVVAVQPGFGEYQAKTSRVIPLFELQRV